MNVSSNSSFVTTFHRTLTDLRNQFDEYFQPSHMPKIAAAVNAAGAMEILQACSIFMSPDEQQDVMASLNRGGEINYQGQVIQVMIDGEDFPRAWMVAHERLG